MAPAVSATPAVPTVSPVVAASTGAAATATAPPKFYGSPVCPWASRTWLALELLGIKYEYVEIDLDNKAPDFVAQYAKAVGAPKTPNPVAKVPLLVDAEFPDGLVESATVTSYLFNSAAVHGAPNPGGVLIKLTPRQQAIADLFTEQVTSRFTKAFYTLLTAATPDAAAAAEAEYLAAHVAFGVAQREAGTGAPAGPFVLGAQPSIADVLLFPFIVRSVVIERLRGVTVPETDEYAPFHAWRRAIFAVPGATATVRDEAYYVKAYTRYVPAAASKD